MAWGVITMFITMRLVKGDLKRIKDPVSWDFMFTQSVCMDFMIAIMVTLYMHSGFFAWNVRETLHWLVER